MIDSADYYASRNNWEKAELFTLNALKLQPAKKTNWLLWANLGDIKANLNKNEEALEAYNIGLGLNPDSKKLLAGRAHIYVEQGRKADAISDLSSLLRNDSTLEWPRLMRGFIYLDSNRPREAASDFDFLIRMHPENAKGYYGRALVHNREGEPNKAIGMLEKSIAIDDNEDTYFTLISSLMDLGKLPQAEEFIREAMKKFPRNGNMFLLRAYLHKLNFQNKEAEIALKLAKEYKADMKLYEVIFPKIVTSTNKK